MASGGVATPATRQVTQDVVAGQVEAKEGAAVRTAAVEGLWEDAVVGAEAAVNGGVTGQALHAPFAVDMVPAPVGLHRPDGGRPVARRRLAAGGADGRPGADARLQVAVDRVTAPRLRLRRQIRPTGLLGGQVAALRETGRAAGHAAASPRGGFGPQGRPGQAWLAEHPTVVGTKEEGPRLSRPPPVATDGTAITGTKAVAGRRQEGAMGGLTLPPRRLPTGAVGVRPPLPVGPPAVLPGEAAASREAVGRPKDAGERPHRRTLVGVVRTPRAAKRVLVRGCVHPSGVGAFASVCPPLPAQSGLSGAAYPLTRAAK